MEKKLKRFQKNGLVFTTVLLGTSVFFSACKSDDPQPVNEEELITTVKVVLTPTEGEAIELKFVDLDGDGAGEPVVTPVVAQLSAGVSYAAATSFLNESGTTPENITTEIEEENNDHLICFEITSADITIGYDDEDSNNKPVGLLTTWTAGESGTEGTVKITLRHQPGSKTGECPGTGDTDVEVVFPIQVIN